MVRNADKSPSFETALPGNGVAAWADGAGVVPALAGLAGWEQPVASASKAMADTAVTPRRRN